jgi:hypothetical protein
VSRHTGSAERIDAVPKEAVSARHGFDDAVAGKRAECDGGGLFAPMGLPRREEFTGKLTGEYVDHGDPPWRWYLMVELSRKPDGYPFESVWCESESLFFLKE